MLDSMLDFYTSKTRTGSRFFQLRVQHFGAEKLDNELNIKWEPTFLMTCSKTGDVFFETTPFYIAWRRDLVEQARLEACEMIARNARLHLPCSTPQLPNITNKRKNIFLCCMHRKEVIILS